jgi:hypothetical protein
LTEPISKIGVIELQTIPEKLALNCLEHKENPYFTFPLFIYIQELEPLVGKLTLENNLLRNSKKASPIP